MPAKRTVIVALALAALLGATYWLWTPDKSKAEIERKYLGAVADYLTVDGLKLHVRESGPPDAPPIIMLHGFGSSLHTWEDWAQAMAPAYRAVRFDLPGFGLTGPDPAHDYSDARSIAVLSALMTKLGIARATLIGNSMGGRIAWKFAAAYPEKVDRLVLISPDGFAMPGMPYGAKPSVPSMVKLMQYVLPKALLAPNLAVAYADPKFMTDALLTRYYDLMLAPGNRRAIISRMEHYVLVDPEPDLKRIQADTLLLWGDKDRMIPLSNSADYLRLLPHARLVTLPGLGHLPHEEAPSVALKPVLEFLGRPTRTP